jgi:polar amino acid transport system permease protein
MNYEFAFGKVLPNLPYLLGGTLITLQIAFIAFFAGAILGLGGALGKVYGAGWLQRSIGGYVIFVTNTPALVQIFFLHNALPEMGLLLEPMTSVMIGLTLNSAAYLTEIIRAGVISVRRAEMEAAIALNMTRGQILRFVMLPHIAKTIYAPLSNFFIWLMLGSSMAALFGVEELTGRAINISAESLLWIETFSFVALFYVAMTLLASASLALIGRYVFRVKARIF